MKKAKRYMGSKTIKLQVEADGDWGGYSLNFYIQASNPRYQYITEQNDEYLSEAIESIFPMNTENAILTWNYISIPLSYKYDISYMLNDVLELINLIQNNSAGKKVIHWLPDTFRCDWSVEWNNGIIWIYSQWECTIGHLEGILNEKNSICISISDFVSEWKKVFEIVLKGLESCGYEKNKIQGMNELVVQYNKIKELGVLYKE